MYLKTLGSVLFAASSISLLTWGSFEAHNSFKYSEKMSKYDQSRKEFYEKGLYDIYYMCTSSTIKNCLSGNNWKFKQYLPSFYEEDLWEWLYESLNSNNKEIIKNQVNRPLLKPQLENVKSTQDLKDHCYSEIKKSIYKFDSSGNKSYFHPSGDDNPQNKEEKAHKMCVMSIQTVMKIKQLDN